MSNELYHYGVKGQKWGVRRNKTKSGVSHNKTKSETKKDKLHLGLDKNGNINLIRGKTTTNAKKAFAIKTALLVGSIGLTSYIITHPSAVENGKKNVESLFKKPVKVSSKPVMSGIFSKTLGRELTLIEAFEAGFDLSD